MKIETISILNGLTVMVGDHQFAKADFQMGARFEEDDDIADSIEKLSSLVTIFLKKEISKLFEITGVDTVSKDSE